RGGALDIFGYAKERRTERQLIADYEKTVGELLEKLEANRIDLAAEIGAIPRIPRGGDPRDRRVHPRLRPREGPPPRRRQVPRIPAPRAVAQSQPGCRQAHPDPRRGLNCAWHNYQGMTRPPWR